MTTEDLRNMINRLEHSISLCDPQDRMDWVAELKKLQRELRAREQQN